MNPLAIPIFDLAQARLSWTAQRQRVLAENIANIDTPQWQPKDVTSFADMLSGTGAAATMVQTSPLDLPGNGGGAPGTHVVTEGGRQPDGNAVSLDTETEKVAETDGVQQEVTAIYQSYLGLFRTAIGQG
jgi:flagellar basal-body rod protein FlgB